LDAAVERAEARCKEKGLSGMEYWREMYAAILLHARIAETQSQIAAICELDGCCVLRDKTGPQNSPSSKDKNG